MGDMKTVTRQHGSNLQLACFRFMHISGCIHFEVAVALQQAGGIMSHYFARGDITHAIDETGVLHPLPISVPRQRIEYWSHICIGLELSSVVHKNC